MNIRLTQAILATVALLAGGCAGGKVTYIANEQDFDRRILHADRPALVEFYKSGCPRCLPFDKTMDQLVDEYGQRAVIAKFMAVLPVGLATSAKLKAQYDLVFFPTVVLFVNGKVQRRWVLRTDINEYRQGLEEALGGPAAPDP